MTVTLVLKKGFYPKEYIYTVYVTCENSITYHSKAMTNVKVFADKQPVERTDGRTHGQTDGQKNRPKTICPRSIDAGEHKKRRTFVEKKIV